MKIRPAQRIPLDVDTPELIARVSTEMSQLEDDLIESYRQSVAGVTLEEQATIKQIDELTDRLREPHLSKAGRLRMERTLDSRVGDAALLFRSREWSYYPFIGRGHADYINLRARQVLAAIEELNERVEIELLRIDDRDVADTAEEFRKDVAAFKDSLHQRPKDLEWYRDFLQFAELDLAATSHFFNLALDGSKLTPFVDRHDHVSAAALEHDVLHQFARSHNKNIWFAADDNALSPASAVAVLVLRGVDRQARTPFIDAQIAWSWGPNVVLSQKSVSFSVEQWITQTDAPFNYLCGSGRLATRPKFGEAGLLPAHVVGQRAIDRQESASPEPGEVEIFWLLGAARFAALNRAYELRKPDPFDDRGDALASMSEDWTFNGREGIDF